MSRHGSSGLRAKGKEQGQGGLEPCEQCLVERGPKSVEPWDSYLWIWLGGELGHKLPCPLDIQGNQKSI